MLTLLVMISKKWFLLLFTILRLSYSIGRFVLLSYPRSVFGNLRRPYLYFLYLFLNKYLKPTLRLGFAFKSFHKLSTSHSPIYDTVVTRQSKTHNWRITISSPFTTTAQLLSHRRIAGVRLMIWPKWLEPPNIPKLLMVKLNFAIATWPSGVNVQWRLLNNYQLRQAHFSAL